MHYSQSVAIFAFFVFAWFYERKASAKQANVWAKSVAWRKEGRQREGRWGTCVIGHMPKYFEHNWKSMCEHGSCEEIQCHPTALNS